jgi:hypothetical protein
LNFFRKVLMTLAPLVAASCLLGAQFPTNTPHPPEAEAESTPTVTPMTPTAIPPTATPGPTPIPLPGQIGPAFPENVNPLTGLMVADPETLNHRPIVTKISNAPPLVRPQAGLNAADLVFEHYAEGGLTRFSAVFYSQLPQRVGSVRSGRLIDYELVPMYRALLVYSGASNGVQQIIADGDFADRAYYGVNYGRPYYFRDEEIEVPHNLFANVAAVSQLATDEGVNERPALQGMAFHTDVPRFSTQDANLIDIRYYATRVQWEWDAENGVYRRFSDGQPHYDATTETQVTANNVVVIYANHRFTDIVESQFQDRVSYSIEIKLWFEGLAVLFRDGRMYEGLWWRPTREDMITLRTYDGQYLYLKPGNTWFQVMRPPVQQNPAEEGLSVE